MTTSDAMTTSRIHSDPAYGQALLVALSGMASADPARTRLRASTIEWYLPVAAHLARRYSYRGEPVADLIQAAAIGLIKAVDRYDPSRGVPFTSYAYPTILGEIKRHFRDTTWAVRVPRGLQEGRAHLATTMETLAGQLRRIPTTADLATALGIGITEVGELQRVAEAYRPSSPHRLTSEGEESSLLDEIGGNDPGFDSVDQRLTLRMLLTELPARDQHILRLRYGGGLTQTEIATQIGVSQMQISRLLKRSLTTLHNRMIVDGTEVTSPRHATGGPWRAHDVHSEGAEGLG